MLGIPDISSIVMIALLVMTIVPVISFCGRVFTRAGRSLLLSNPFIVLYYIIFFTFAYFFWTASYAIVEYIGISLLMQKMLYGALALVPFLERDVSS